jgi:hypothetical protein
MLRVMIDGVLFAGLITTAFFALHFVCALFDRCAATQGWL